MKTESKFKVLPWLRALRDQHAEKRRQMTPGELAAEDAATEVLAKAYAERARKAKEPFREACVAESRAAYGSRK